MWGRVVAAFFPIDVGHLKRNLIIYSIIIVLWHIYILYSYNIFNFITLSTPFCFVIYKHLYYNNQNIILFTVYKNKFNLVRCLKRMTNDFYNILYRGHLDIITLKYH